MFCKHVTKLWNLEAQNYTITAEVEKVFFLDEFGINSFMEETIFNKAWVIFYDHVQVCKISFYYEEFYHSSCREKEPKHTAKDLRIVFKFIYCILCM